MSLEVESILMAKDCFKTVNGNVCGFSCLGRIMEFGGSVFNAQIER